MNAEQAWQSVLGQLQLEMPRASFDTWVRDTKPVSYQDGMLTIGVRNAYARDWLENRLSSTVNRLLFGVTSSTVDVKFIVSGMEADQIADEPPPLRGKPIPAIVSEPSGRSLSINSRYCFESD